MTGTPGRRRKYWLYSTRREHRSNQPPRGHLCRPLAEFSAEVRRAHLGGMLAADYFPPGGNVWALGFGFGGRAYSAPARWRRVPQR